MTFGIPYIIVNDDDEAVDADTGIGGQNTDGREAALDDADDSVPQSMGSADDSSVPDVSFDRFYRK